MRKFFGVNLSDLKSTDVAQRQLKCCSQEDGGESDDFHTWMEMGERERCAMRQRREFRAE